MRRASNDKFLKNVNKARIKTDIFSIIFTLLKKSKNLPAKFIRNFYPQFLFGKFIRKIYPQFLSAKFIRKIYPQNLSAKSIRKIYPQFLSAIFIRKIYPQNLSAKSIRNFYPQSAIRTRIFHQTLCFSQ